VRKQIAPVFELADRYLALNRTKDAQVYYLRALQYQPWNLPAQLSLAQLLMQAGDTNATRARAELVWTNAETDALLAEAARLLNQPFPAEFPVPESPQAGRVTLTLVPDQGVDTWLLLALRDDLAARLAIPVVIRRIPWPFPAPGRDPRHLRADDLRQRIATSHLDPTFRSQLKRLKLTTNALTSDDAVFGFAEKILGDGPDPEVARRLREEADYLQRLGPQWDSQLLVAELARAAACQPGGSAGYLGVTRRDLYSKDSRYVFGLASINGNCGALSYLRYTSALTDAAPNRQRLRERTLKQALSSTGLLFGLPRCTDPTCARAYANSLEEHDAKQLGLCRECQDSFARRFASPSL
jgi:predicted Zn-dependent protease